MVVVPEPPTALRQVIEQIVTAVREGDDARICVLLERFAGEADLSALLMLRRQLYQDLDAHPGPGCHAGREDRTGCWSVPWKQDRRASARSGWTQMRTRTHPG